MIDFVPNYKTTDSMSKDQYNAFKEAYEYLFKARGILADHMWEEDTFSEPVGKTEHELHALINSMVKEMSNRLRIHQTPGQLPKVTIGNVN